MSKDGHREQLGLFSIFGSTFFELVGYFMLLPLLLLRLLAAASMHRRLSPQTFRWADLWLVPVKDVLNAAIWLAAFTGNHVVWRGVKYRVKKGGELIRE